METNKRLEGMTYYPGLVKQMMESDSKDYYDSILTIEKLNEFLEDISKNISKDRFIYFSTGKQGAIDFYIELEKKYMKFIGKEMTEQRERQYREELQSTLKDGLYEWDGIELKYIG